MLASRTSPAVCEALALDRALRLPGRMLRATLLFTLASPGAAHALVACKPADCVTLLMLAAAPTTLCTSPDSASTPICVFIPRVVTCMPRVDCCSGWGAFADLPWLEFCADTRRRASAARRANCYCAFFCSKLKNAP